MPLSPSENFHVSVDSALGRPLISVAPVVNLRRLIGNTMEAVTALTARAGRGSSRCPLDASVHYGTQPTNIRAVVIYAVSADEPDGLLHGGADVGIIEKSRGVLLQWAVKLVVAGGSVAPVHHNFEDDIFVAICLYPAVYLTVADLRSIRIIRIRGRGAYCGAVGQVASSTTETNVADESKLLAA